VDALEQCAAMGDLRHALAAGAMTADDVEGDLAQLVSGRVAGRANAQEIIVFDSTGVGVADAASAAAIYRRALRAGVGRTVAVAG
jgi:ornithine cyclodeaminase/alanine dehydrogenase-like protein (mu-crystallin family)